MSLWGGEESRASTTNMILWPKVLCAPCLRWQVAARLQEGCGSHPVPDVCPEGLEKALGVPKEPGRGAGERARTSVCLTYPGECWKVN